mgnify:CR=1 FL=1
MEVKVDLQEEEESEEVLQEGQDQVVREELLRAEQELIEEDQGEDAI